MKKVISTLLALSLIAGGINATTAAPEYAENSKLIVADAATADTSEAGEAQTVKASSKYSLVKNTSWVDKTNGNTYQIAQINGEYTICLTKVKNTNITVDMSEEIEIDSEVAAKLEDSQKPAKNVATVIADKAFYDSYLKEIDLTGVVYIGANAFQKCQYITEITIPASVEFVGSYAFDSSGLKTLTVNNKMTEIPQNFCNSTKLTKITFAHPELIEVIGKNSFSNTPLAAPIFNSWSDVSAYKPLVRVEDNAFSGCTSMKSVVVADNIYYLGKNAFKGCTGIESVVFGKILNGCDQNCFNGCTSLKSIKFNDCVESLAGGCFQGCTSLVEVSGIPATVHDWEKEDAATGTGIGSGVFADCTSLQSVVIPRSLARIAPSMFENDVNLAKITFQNPGGEAVTESPEIVKIKAKAFKNCPKITKVSYPNVVEVEESGFEGCTGVVSVSIPSSQLIRKTAFKGCTSMTSFKAGECQIVGDNALEGCTAITDITLLSNQYGGDEDPKNSPDLTNSSHGYVFKDCTAAKKITIKTAGNNKLSSGLFSGCSALESVNADVTGIQIIGKDCFSGCTKLPKLNFSGLKIIEASGFANCSSLKSISDSGNKLSATDYGSKCFQNCSALNIEVNGVISTIGSYAFDKSAVTKVDIDGMEGGTVVIGDYAFSNCELLSSAKIGSDGVEKFSVGSNIFANCPVLKEAVFDGNIITKAMFQNCAELASLKTSADKIYDNAFSGCSKLPQVTNLEGTAAVVAAEINGGAFANCAALTNSSSDKNTVFKGSGQYAGCSSLTSAEVKALTASMFQNCSNLTSVSLGEDVVSVPNNCFQNCSKFANFDFSKITSIGTSAFEGTAVKKIAFGAPCDIGQKAFNNCISLESVTGEVVNVGSNAFNNCSALNEAVLKSSSSNPIQKIGSNAFTNCSSLGSITIYGNPSVAGKSVGYVGGKEKEGFTLLGEGDGNVKKYADSNGFNYLDANSGEKPPVITSTTTTATTTTSKSTTTTTTTTKKPGTLVYGDANCDGAVDMSDAVIIMQALAAPNKYGPNGSDSHHITEQGRLNGDVDLSSAGITSNDALRIQQYLLKKISSLDPTK